MIPHPPFGRHDCPDPPSLSSEGLRRTHQVQRWDSLRSPVRCFLQPARLRARALRSGPRASAHARLASGGGCASRDLPQPERAPWVGGGGSSRRAPPGGGAGWAVRLAGDSPFGEKHAELRACLLKWGRGRHPPAIAPPRLSGFGELARPPRGTPLSPVRPVRRAQVFGTGMAKTANTWERL